MTIRREEATAILKMQGMSDPGRAKRFRSAVDKLDGVFRVDINYILDTVTIKYDADKLTLAQVRKKLAPSESPSRLGLGTRGTTTRRTTDSGGTGSTQSR